VFAVERLGFDSDPQRDGGGGSDLADANDIEAGPQDLTAYVGISVRLLFLIGQNSS
jgi:hypothetical protein